MLGDLRQSFRDQGLTTAVADHDAPVLYDWLIRLLSLQGVADAVAWSYLDRHGSVEHAEVTAALQAKSRCPKLRSHWHFESCGFAKTAFSCSEPALVEHCPLPRHDLRNGRLNQTAYSLALFLRDVCDGDLVGWIDARLADLPPAMGPDTPAVVRSTLIEPLTQVYGVGAKVLSMSLADLLLAADPARERWVTAGASLIAVDSLVHNWLQRTGSLADAGAELSYGPGCYGPNGCAMLIARAAEGIDAREWCPEGPAHFPRLIQIALWRFCAAGGLDICNGNRIDDRRACEQTSCPIEQLCSKVPLKAVLSR